MQPVISVGGVQVFRDGDSLRWSGGLRIDGDGSPRCYHPDDWGPPRSWTPAGRGPLGLDAPESGGRAHLDPVTHLWVVDESWGWVTGGGSRAGAPAIQGPGDPAPGYYVSTTALQDHRYARTDPRRYVDSESVAYLSVPPELLHLGVRLGGLARVTLGDHSCDAVVADVGPRRKLGEGSIALARSLGVQSDPRTGGVTSGVTVSLRLG